MGATKNNNEEQELSALTEEEMQKAVKQIVFDLGVETDQARKWAEEAQTKLLEERKANATKEVVVCKVDADHINDEEVPAELVPRQHEAQGYVIDRIIDSVKTTFGKAVGKA